MAWGSLRLRLLLKYPQRTQMHQLCSTVCCVSWQAMTYSTAPKRMDKVKDCTLPDPYASSSLEMIQNDSNEGSSVSPLFLLHHDEVFMKSWYHFNEAILEGGIPFTIQTYGMTVFEYQATDQRFNQVFNEAMSNHTTLFVKKIIEVYDGFDGVKVLVDVGGGIGDALRIITSKYPHIKGINFDLPNVLADAPSFPGVEHVAGDMFVSVPKGDAIFMKWILHGWSDEYCLKLLKNCYEALPSKGKVIVAESILPLAPENAVSSHIVFEQDLFMFAQTPGGKERTQKDYETLAMKSGFSSCEVVCCAYNSWVMEFHKA
ncbi:caffeic acid 3-O-methyltransferase 2 [Jatropha curcas]|uniref:caffeic acid 3-O-methyltransferase 2 n=2 Tax=Jatropha curcas TaxID=180498 RepID=UPI001894627C|nr:caffeic acid 3-O-methyltransferase 2 [Jatropha curcas]